ncbi:unnamed protein product, partial [Prunus brigantina]
MIYRVSEAITGMVLRRLEDQGSYDILMNGFSLQSITTPRKAYKGIESALQEKIICSVGGFWSLGGTIEAEKTCMVESDRGKWVVQSAFGIVKHGGVTPINPG